MGVFLIEDHSLVRGGFRRLIQAASDLEVVGEAANLEEALPLIQKLKPSVVSLDLMLPGVSGTEAVEKLFATQPNINILVVSSRTEAPEIQALLQLGVLGYVTKDASSESFLTALQKVSRGESYLGAEAASSLARGFREKANKPEIVLPKRLIEVLQFIAKGKKTREIAEELYLSPKTIEKYRGQILRKLNAGNQIQALQKARELGLLQDGGEV